MSDSLRRDRPKAVSEQSTSSGAGDVPQVPDPNIHGGAPRRAARVGGLSANGSGRRPATGDGGSSSRPQNG